MSVDDRRPSEIAVTMPMMRLPSIVPSQTRLEPSHQCDGVCVMRHWDVPVTCEEAWC